MKKNYMNLSIKKAIYLNLKEIADKKNLSMSGLVTYFLEKHQEYNSSDNTQRFINYLYFKDVYLDGLSVEDKANETREMMLDDKKLEEKLKIKLIK